VSVLLIDRGNTRLKWRLIQSGQVVSSGVGLKHEPLLAIFSDLDVNAIADVYVASVADQSFDDEMTEWAVTHGLPKLRFVSSPKAAFGVVNGYEEPSQLGVDRWLGMVAAHDKLSGNLCVVDVGTALTIDIVLGNGDHLGGYIVPGSELQIQTLLKNTDKIHIGGENGAMSVGKNTHQAVKLGIKRMLVSFVTQAVTDWERELSGPVKLVMTGGGAKELALSLAIPCFLEENLVFDGLNMMTGNVE